MSSRLAAPSSTVAPSSLSTFAPVAQEEDEKQLGTRNRYQGIGNTIV